MKKLLSLLLSVLMISALITVPAYALGEYVKDADMEGVSYTVGTGSWIVSYDPAVDGSTLAATEMDNANANYNVGNRKNAGVYKIPLPEIPAGKAIETAEFRMSSYYPTARYMPYSYKLPGEQDMSTITVADMREYITASELGSGEYYLADVQIGDEYKLDTNYRNRYDATDYVIEAMANGQENIWFAVTYYGTIKAYRHNYSGQEAKLFYTLKDVPAFELEESTPEDGAKKCPISGEAVFTFSADVKSAQAKVDGKTADATIDGNTVTVSYESKEDSLCRIVVTASDQYGQSVSKTISFRTARDTIDAEESALTSSYSDANSEGNPIDGFTPVLKLSDGGATFYSLPAPEVEDGKYLSNYKLKMLVKFPEGTQNAMDAAKSLSAYAIDDEYDVTNANKAGNINAFETDDENTVLIEVELTALARDKANDFVVALASAEGAMFASHEAEDTSVCYEIENNPRINFHSIDVKLWGCEVTYAGFGVYTDAGTIADYATITDDSGFEVKNVKFVYNPHSNRIELANSVVLDEFSNYIIIVREGAADSFGNTIDEEVEVAFFETGKYISVTPEEKEELWNVFTSSDDAEELSENWATFADVYEFDVPSYEDIEDKSVFFKRLASNTEKNKYTAYSESNASKLCEIFEAVASEVNTEQTLLAKISSTAHMSQIKKIITDEDNAKILGIEEYIDDYKSLYSTDSVDKKIMNEEYKEAEEFRDIFVPALEKALKNNKKPSSDSSVGGGASKPSSGGSSVSFGNPGSNPPIVSETEPETKPSASFSDISDYAWASDAIEYLAEKSVVNGRAEGIFAPAENVTRAEFVTMVVNAFGLYNKDAVCTFADVSANDWFAPYVASAVDAGIIMGDGNSFNPNANITREDMAVISLRALEKAGKALQTTKSFTDEALMADYAVDAIGKMAGAGVLSGMPDGSFEPKRNLSRAEAAVVIYNMLTKLS